MTAIYNMQPKHISQTRGELFKGVRGCHSFKQMTEMFKTIVNTYHRDICGILNHCSYQGLSINYLCQFKIPCFYKAITTVQIVIQLMSNTIPNYILNTMTSVCGRQSATNDFQDHYTQEDVVNTTLMNSHMQVVLIVANFCVSETPCRVIVLFVPKSIQFIYYSSSKAMFSLQQKFKELIFQIRNL